MVGRTPPQGPRAPSSCQRRRRIHSLTPSSSVYVRSSAMWMRRDLSTGETLIYTAKPLITSRNPLERPCVLCLFGLHSFCLHHFYRGLLQNVLMPDKWAPDFVVWWCSSRGPASSFGRSELQSLLKELLPFVFFPPMFLS